MIISTDNGTIRGACGDIEAMRLIKEAGFDGIDYTFYDMLPDNDILAFDDDKREKLAYEIREYAEKIGLCFPQCHAHLSYRYGTIGRDESDENYLRVVRSIEYCSRIGCPQIVIHTDRTPIDMPDEESDRINSEFIRSFVPYAEKYDVNIGVENLFKFVKDKNYFIGRQHTAEWMKRFCDSIGSDRIRACVDLGHAAICGTEPETLIRGLPNDLLTMIHVQDTDYLRDRHWLPYLGSHHWDEITSALAEIDFRGSMNLEVLHFYERFDKSLFPQALALAAGAARKLADEVEKKRDCKNSPDRKSGKRENS